MNRRRGPSDGVLLPAHDPWPECDCGTKAVTFAPQFVLANHLGPVIHIAGCATLRKLNFAGTPEPPAKPAKIIIIPGQTWTPPQPPKAPRPRSRRDQASNYKLLLQFFFHRPINIELWKKIRAPKGWRKCPTGKDAQLKYYGVRFQCRELKYALTPDEIEELRARLYLCLEEVF
jgi:hypothetical protein